MSSSVVSPEDVLETLMNDGTIDAIRLKIINQLKANEELRSTTISMVEQSKILNTPGAEKQTKRELFDALRQELESPVLEKASKAVWKLILDNNGLGKEISDTVAKTFFRLSGQEPPQSLQTKGDVQAQRPENTNRQQRKEKERGDTQVQFTENPNRQQRKDKEKDDLHSQHAENTNRQQRKGREKDDFHSQHAENTHRQQRKDKEKDDIHSQHVENTNRQQRKEKERGDVHSQHADNTIRQQRKEKERGSPASSSRKRSLDDVKSKESRIVRESSVASDNSEMRSLKGKV